MGADARLVSWRRIFEGVGRFLLRMPVGLALLLPLAWMALIWSLSAQTLPETDDRFGLWGFFGNLAHAPLFGLLALSWCALLLRPAPGAGLPRVAPARVALVLALVLAYGLVDEWHQSLTPGRQPSGWDVATDVVGAGCVLWVVAYLGSGRAREDGLRGRLLVGLAACALVVLVAP